MMGMADDKIEKLGFALASTPNVSPVLRRALCTTRREWAEANDDVLVRQWGYDPCV